MPSKKTVAICGAGIAGISAAYYLSKFDPSLSIVLIDKNQPLSFTSSKSGENFRDYWPHPCMEALSSYSIELMEGLQKVHGADAFQMVYSGYHFVSQDDQAPIFADDSTSSFRQRNQVTTAPVAIQEKYHYLDKSIKKSVFIKKAGNIDSITMANVLLQSAKEKGLIFRQEEIIDLTKTNTGFRIAFESSQSIEADQLIIATGPFLNHLAGLLDLEFPVWNTLQRKFILPDVAGVIPTDMPFTIYADAQYLDWSAEELDFLKATPSLQWLTQKFPGGLHIKPESGGRMKLGWAFSTEKVPPQWTVPSLEYFPQAVIKGASRFLPGLKAYVQKIPTPIIEYGGYYTRTKENWPLIGPTELDKVYVIGALAGFGSMTACAVGSLCAQYMTQQDLPWFAPYFHPARYENPDIIKELDNLDMDGQL